MDCPSHLRKPFCCPLEDVRPRVPARTDAKPGFGRNPDSVGDRCKPPGRRREGRCKSQDPQGRDRCELPGPRGDRCRRHLPPAARAEPGRPTLAVPRPGRGCTVQRLDLRLPGKVSTPRERRQRGSLAHHVLGPGRRGPPHCTDARRGTRTRLAPSGVAATEGTFRNPGHRGTWTPAPNLPAVWPGGCLALTCRAALA